MPVRNVAQEALYGILSSFLIALAFADDVKDHVVPTFDYELIEDHAPLSVGIHFHMHSRFPARRHRNTASQLLIRVTLLGFHRRPKEILSPRPSIGISRRRFVRLPRAAHRLILNGDIVRRLLIMRLSRLLSLPTTRHRIVIARPHRTFALPGHRSKSFSLRCRSSINSSLLCRTICGAKAEGRYIINRRIEQLHQRLILGSNVRNLVTLYTVQQTRV